MWKHLMILFILFGKSDLEDIKWYIVELPIIFGEDAILFCNVSSVQNCCTNTATWMRDYDVITHHGLSSNPTKYEQRQDKDGFYLIIRSFSENDINCQYTCLYDFYAFSRTIEPNNTDLQARPQTKKAKIEFQKEKVFASVIFQKVLPLPKCDLILNGETLSSTINMTEVSNGLFYDATIKMVCEMESSHCDGEISLDCLIGQYKIPMNLEEVRSDCNTTTDSGVLHPIKTEIIMVICTIPVCVTLIVIGIIIARRKCRLRNCRELESHISETRNILTMCLCASYEHRDVEEMIPLLNDLKTKIDWIKETDIPAQKWKDVVEIIFFEIDNDKRSQKCSLSNIIINEFRKKKPWECRYLGLNFGNHPTKPFDVMFDNHDEQIEISNQRMNKARLQHQEVLASAPTLIVKCKTRSGEWGNNKQSTFPIEIDDHDVRMLMSNKKINQARYRK